MAHASPSSARLALARKTHPPDPSHFHLGLLVGADSDEYPPQVLRYVARFDRREYWLAHEELEELWQIDRRDFFKGLIQVAAAFLHVERQNWRGARRLMKTSLQYLEAAPASYEGFDVAAVRGHVSEALRCVEDLVTGARARFDDELAFAMASVFAGTIDDQTVSESDLPYRVRRYDDGYRPAGGTRDR